VTSTPVQWQELRLVSKHLEERDLALAEEASRQLAQEASGKWSTESSGPGAGGSVGDTGGTKATADDSADRSEVMSPVSLFEEIRTHTASPLPSPFQLCLGEYQDAAATLEKLRNSIQTRPPARLEPETLTPKIRRDLDEAAVRYSNARSAQASRTIKSLGQVI
jgi:hypothetical protein